MNNDAGSQWFALTVLLPGFDDGRWQDVSVVTEAGLRVRLEHREFTGVTMESKMWEHHFDVVDVLHQFDRWVQRRRSMMWL